jgi:hypothetical protein
MKSDERNERSAVSIKNDLVQEVLSRYPVDLVSWLERFAALPPAERNTTVKALRDAVADDNNDPENKQISLSHHLWEFNFTLRALPGWKQIAHALNAELDPPDTKQPDGEDDNGYRLRSDKDWVQTRCRRGFVLDGSPGAWRPVEGTPAEAVVGEPRSASTHHAVSTGEWPDSRLMTAGQLKRDDLNRNVLSVKAGKRTNKW